MMVMMVNDVDPKISYDVLPIPPAGNCGAAARVHTIPNAKIQRVIFSAKY
jgi:hypothetical protein